MRIDDHQHEQRQQEHHGAADGDAVQVLLDDRGARLGGVRSILVKPLVKSDSWVTKFNRWRERRMWKKIEKAYGPMTFNKGI